MGVCHPRGLLSRELRWEGTNQEGRDPILGNIGKGQNHNRCLRV
jgi:hypothetical protein